MRTFLGIPLPLVLAQRIALMGGGIPGARWEPADKLHVTLRFLGELEGAPLREIEDALQDVRLPPFELEFRGVGHFPPRGQPQILWMGILDPAPIIALHRKLERVVTRVGARLGIEPEHRKYTPHLTIARLRNAPVRRVAEFIADHNLLHWDPFEVREFALYSSILAPGGSKYRVERVYALDGDGDDGAPPELVEPS